MRDLDDQLLVDRSTMARWLALTLAGEDNGCGDPPGIQRPGRQEDRDRLEAERIRLFVNAPGGVPAPPYASWWTESTLSGEIAREVARFYREEGLQSGPGAGPPDHLPVLLEFLHFLLQHQIAARRTGQTALELSGREREREFLDRFLAPWLPAFCVAVEKAAPEPFWRRAVALLGSLVASERERLAAEDAGRPK